MTFCPTMKVCWMDLYCEFHDGRQWLEMWPLHLAVILTCICLMAGVPTEMTFNTTSTVKLCQSIIVMTSQRVNTMRHDNALPVTCHSRCASHRTMHMSYRSKTYTWNDVILVKRSMIRVFNVYGWLRTARNWSLTIFVSHKQICNTTFA